MGEEPESDDNDYEKTEKEINEKNKENLKDDEINENSMLKEVYIYIYI
jgi:hypothetical protein